MKNGWELVNYPVPMSYIDIDIIIVIVKRNQNLTCNHLHTLKIYLKLWTVL